ncbi:META domain-containing protein [Piscinibacterium candidicorallinum]|uniref:META domain-containing protein n=1 Tax=Piscinibacterium candidicorallinum TaxID=1793872 RepID=A0ABV7H3Q5_9BURK
MHRFLIVLLALCATACGSLPAQTAAPDRAVVVTVDVTASYRERIALPPGAVLEVTAADVARADAAARPVASVRVAAGAGGLMQAQLKLPSAALQPPARVSVRARVLAAEVLLFTSDTAAFVAPEPAQQKIELLLRRVSAAGGAPAASAEPRTQRYWGRYSLMADTGTFIDCASGQRLWVVQEEANAALEAAAIRARKQPGDAVLATVDGRITQRPYMEGPVRPALIVSSVVDVAAEAQCPAQLTAPLINTYWELTELGGQPPALPPHGRRPHFMLQPEPQGAPGVAGITGHSGCNRMTGAYKLRGSELSFERMAGTLMACAGADDLERSFLRMLNAVRTWRTNGQELELRDEGGKVIARFQSRLM